jgi:CheY-like chemotaxis protein
LSIITEIEHPIELLPEPEVRGFRDGCPKTKQPRLLPGRHRHPLTLTMSSHMFERSNRLASAVPPSVCASGSEPQDDIPTVLVLDDDEDCRALVIAVLSKAGFLVYSLPDGRRVNEILGQYRIDLLVTDIVMPERDGIETITALRYSHPRLPVIAISGVAPMNTELYLRIAKKLGAFRVLNKPFRPNELLVAAREAIMRDSTLASSTQEHFEQSFLGIR